ncbi:carboxypeptidase-like regulatory domain-containing protein [Zeaxanthinibacter sp. PT1]|uniref:carboxypeptidase-like regulatory domain-containing protein n=1 Tax=Zeaxanthinibacter TaxID=561554 RepID=UPI00234998D7|nr:carboxypeptidase-like regulatory domain-containing protein [Zeaxanthinibacter sp. PT1]MDC6352591.1 carboxypeptidase-like regulatory domain-containing protein [Zeaxanthinibacter sp. PT1]
MPRKPHKHLFLLLLILVKGHFLLNAQEVPNRETIPVISYLQELERRYDVKFSFVDEDLEDVVIQVPIGENLDTILARLSDQTQLKVQKLSDRYYTLSRSRLIDVCGTVLDNFEQNSIVGASVEVLGSSISMITDFDGQFKLEQIPRGATLRIQHIGYKPLYINASYLIQTNPCTQIPMALRYEQLDEVVVYNILTTGIAEMPDGSLELDLDRFGILPGLSEPDILQSVQALPGIRSIDETVSDINIRGGTNDQNLILWDGIKMYQSGHFFGLISAFNPYLTKKVTLIKNGTSAQYGDGVSGIILMETHDRVDDKAFGGAGFNLISGDAYAYVPLSGKLGFQWSARRSVTDFLDTPTYKQFFSRAFQDTEVKGDSGADTDITQEEDFYFYDFTAKLMYDINELHKARISFIHINNDLAYTETDNQNDRENQSTLDQTNLSFGAVLHSDWTDNFHSRINTYYTRYNLDARTSTNDEEQQLFQNNRVLESSIKVNTWYDLSDELSWHNGYQFSEVGITNTTTVTQPPFNSSIKGVIRTHAPYSELEYKTTNGGLMARGGARVNFIENLDTFSEVIIEPRLNLSMALTPNWRLSAMGEFKNQTTNQVIDLEQNFLGIEKRRWILSDNQGLPVTKSKQGSLGFNYEKNKWYMGLETFYKQVEGISTATQGFQNQDQFNGEIGSYDVKGVEFLLNHQADRISAWVSYTYNENTYTFEDINPNRFPNNLDIRHAATLAGTYTYNQFKLGLGLHYRTGKPYTEPQEGNNIIDLNVFPNRIRYQEPNSSRLPDYLRADASAVYEFKIGQGIDASVGASVLNLLNKKNLLNVYYRLNEQDEVERVESASLGLTPNISARIKF